MSQFNLTPIATVISDAASAEHGARDKWVKAGKALAKLGVTSGMLVKGTEKNPNDVYDPVLHAEVRQYIIQGVSASKKSIKLDGRTWTVAELVALKGDALRSIDDDMLKTQRRVYLQLIDGPMMSRVREYIDRANGVERVRKAKETKPDAKADAPMMPKTWATALPILSHLMSVAPTMAVSDTVGHLNADDIAAVQNALNEAIVRIRRNVK